MRQTKNGCLIAVLSVLGLLLILILPLCLFSASAAKKREAAFDAYEAKMPSELVSPEIAERIDPTEYDSFWAGNWYFTAPPTLKKLSDTPQVNALYWTMDDSQTFLLRAGYDSRDGLFKEDVLVKSDFVYPNIQSDSIAQVILAEQTVTLDYGESVLSAGSAIVTVTPDFTAAQRETLRQLFCQIGTWQNEVGGLQVTVLPAGEWETDANGAVKSWRFRLIFEAEPQIYLEYAYLIRNKNGDFYLSSEPYVINDHSDYRTRDFIELPEDIQQKLQAAFENQTF